MWKGVNCVAKDEEFELSVPTTNESSDDSQEFLTKEEQLRLFSDKVVSAIIGNKSIRNYALNKLLSSTKPELFRNENYIIILVMFKFRGILKNTIIDKDFLELHLDANKDIILKSSNFIDIHAYGEIDGSEVLGYISGVVKQFERLRNMEDMSEEDFNLWFNKYLTVFRVTEAQKVYIQSSQILSEGLAIGSKKLVGFDDSYNYSRRKLAEIEGLIDKNSGSGFSSMRDIILSEKDESSKSEKVTDFGELEKLNELFGGIYSGMFYEILAPSKCGKSKLCARICHTAIVKYGTNVTVWAQEGGNEAWTAQMRAIHFDYTYNDDSMAMGDRKTGVSQDGILHSKLSPELAELESVSKLDLVANTSYGNVDYIDRPFEVETFLEDIDTSVKANNSKLLIIDYLQLIESANSRTSERERISKAYTSLLSYCKKNNIAVLTPAQYKQETIDNLSKSGDTSKFEARTAGGGSSEVFRTPDVIIGLWASIEDLRNNRLTIMSVPCRVQKAYDEIPCYIDLASCRFISES